MQGHARPCKAMQGHTRPYKAIQDDTRTHKAMVILMRPHMVMAMKSNKTIRGHTRQTRKLCTIICHRSTFFDPLHNFCSIWNISYSCFYAKNTNNNNNKNNKAFLGPLSVARGQKPKNVNKDVHDCWKLFELAR